MRFLILLMLWPLPGLASPKVITSIEPLYLITASIMQGGGKPELLIEGQASPHHFAFKPSHLRALKSSDLVIWVDRHFEAGFQNLHDLLPPNTRRLELLRYLGLGHSEGHFWYSPSLLLSVIDAIRDTLGRVDSENGALYARNAEALSQRVRLWQARLGDQIGSNPPRYLLDHNFLGRFETDMGIAAIGVLHDEHEQPGSLRDMRDLENKLRHSPAKCLLTDHQSASALARNLAKKYGLAIYNIRPGEPGDFVDILYHLGRVLAKCN